uniref:PARP1 n=2 Tax=Arundo donax TaxID=35708 RepID=A0A0A9DUS2_ARUDO
MMLLSIIFKEILCSCFLFSRCGTMPVASSVRKTR